MPVSKSAILSAVTGTSLVLAGLGAVAPMAMADESTAVLEQSESSGSESVNRISQIEGTFSYDQNMVTGNTDIHNIFCRAAATLCTASPDYGVSPMASAMVITWNVTDTLNATVGDLISDTASDSYVMGCACSTNGPGGGAMANAEVSGVSLASVVQAARNA